MFLAALVLGVVLGWLLTWILQERVNKDLQNQNDILERDLAAAQRELDLLKAAKSDSAKASAAVDAAEDAVAVAVEEVVIEAEVEAVIEESRALEVDTADAIAEDGELVEEALVVEESSIEEAPELVDELAAEEEIDEVVETEERLAAVIDIGEPIAADEKTVDDLTVIRGIGPKYAETLRSAGYTSIAEIAKATPDELREAMPETHNLAHFDDWIAQANDLLNQ